MKKHITTLFVGMALACSTAAYADSISDYVHLEVGVGASKFQPIGNMIWYQDGLQHSLHMESPGFQIGLTGPIYRAENYGVDWHLDYVYLGSVNSQAVATTDENYDPVRKAVKSQSVVRSQFNGLGNVNGVTLAIEPYFQYGGLRFGLLAGLFAYRATWHITLYDPRVPEPTHADYHPRISLGAVTGVSVSRGPFSVRYQHFFDKPAAQEFPPIWSSTDMVTVMYRF